MIERFLRLISLHPAAVIVVILAVTVLAGAGMFDRHSGAFLLQIDPSVDRLLPKGDPDSQFYEHVRKVFGNEDAILIAVSTDDIFTRSNIRRIARITDRLQELPEVHHVLSLATAPNLRVGEEVLDVGTVVQQIEADPSLAGQLRKDVLGNPLYNGSLVSADGRVAAILVYLKDIGDREFLDREIEKQVSHIATDEAGDAKVWITGAPVVKAAATRALLRELGIAIPGIALISAILLLVVFRAASTVVLPMVTIVLALVWTLGTLSWLGRPLNLVTTIVPPLIITMCLSFSMYVLAEYSAVLSSQDARKGLRASAQQVLAGLSLPLSITSITGIAGFLALLPSPLAATREFAWLSALGVFYIWILTMTFLPAALSLVGPRAGKMPVRSVQAFRTLAARLSRFHIAYRRNILIGSAVLLVLTLVGVAKIRSGTNFIDDFAKDSPVRMDYEAVSRTFGGANTFYVVIDGGSPDSVIEPSALEAIQSLEEWLAEQPEIGKTTSVVGYLKVIQRGFGGAAATGGELPSDRRLIKQLLVFGGGDDITSVVDRGFRTTNIIVRTTVEDTAGVSRLMRKIQPHLEALPAPLHGRVTGSSVLLAQALSAITEGQLLSVSLALAAIFLIMAALFTSYRAAFLGLLPNILPIAIYFGTLGLAGIPLNPTTSLIACIVLGVAANDTILYFVRFNTDARRTASESKAAFSALQDVLRPVTYTATALCLGFLVLTTSELRNQVEFGLLASFTLVAAWLANIIVTPALATGVRIVTLWDVLRLDLGHDPQNSIPLMRDLNLRQARTFALLSDVMDLKAGTRVITEGEMGDDMYIVIDGQLRVYLERPDGVVELDTFGRGVILGEIGYFVHKRTANVDTVTDVRLLRFNENSLERLRRWRPWIAAVVYRNLNRVMAERLARTTNMMR